MPTVALNDLPLIACVLAPVAEAAKRDCPRPTSMGEANDALAANSVVAAEMACRIIDAYPDLVEIAIEWALTAMAYVRALGEADTGWRPDVGDLDSGAKYVRTLGERCPVLVNMKPGDTLMMLLHHAAPIMQARAEYEVAHADLSGFGD